ncbi:MAG TPA: hypothetical protein PL180_19590, partial [Spirochaetota bacterium]|nr:hypothetical protein [Spirochaetota bacterium]
MMRIAVRKYRFVVIAAAALVLALLLSDTTWTGTRNGNSPAQLRAQTNIEKKKDEIFRKFNEKKEQLVRSPEEMKQILADVQKKIKEKNMSFVVSLNEMMKYKISQITGAQVPRNIEKEAKVQSEMGDKMWAEFLKKYRDYLEGKKGGRDRDSYRKKKHDEYYEDIDRDRREEGKKEEEKKLDEYSYKEEKKKEEEKQEEKKGETDT